MLSFEPAVKRSFIIADAHNKTTGEKFHLWFNPVYNSKDSLIEISDKLPVLLAQEEVCLEKYNVSPEIFRNVAENVASGGSGVRLVRNKRMLHRYLQKHLAKIAKSELDFSDEKDEIILSLHLDTSRKKGASKQSYITTAISNTGAGKTYTLVHEFLLKDKNKKNRTYHYFSPVPADESMNDLIKFANRDPANLRFMRVELDPDDEERDTDEFEPPKLALKDYGPGDVLFFDDVAAMSRENPYRESVLNLMINGCLRARHTECQIISTSHHLRANRLTKNLRQSSKWLLLFPRASKLTFQH